MWIYAQFLLDIQDWRTALVYAEKSEAVFAEQGLNDTAISYYHDVRAIAGVAKMRLFKENMLQNKPYLHDARALLRELEKVRGKEQEHMHFHLNELRQLVHEYDRLR